jgi:hypothetical protein
VFVAVFADLHKNMKLHHTRQNIEEEKNGVCIVKLHHKKFDVKLMIKI